MHMDRPRQSGDEQTLHVLVSWQHPPGYDDSDIYGYSPPTAYPIRCQAPEDRLSQPRLELVSGGARLHLNLPVDVLQERYYWREGAGTRGRHETRTLRGFRILT